MAETMKLAQIVKLSSLSTFDSSSNKLGYNNLEIDSLIWLDAAMNDSKEMLDTQQRLRMSINYLRTFQSSDVCEQYIRSVPCEDRIVLIVNHRLGQQLVPHIHQLQQVSSIYIFCTDNKPNQQWTKEFTKIKGVLSQLDSLVAQIRSERARRSHNKIDEPLVLSVFNSNRDSRFVRSQLLIDCLLRVKENSTDQKELIRLCEEEYKGNKGELTVVREFEQNYSAARSLRWYTRKSFLFRILNKALRVQNIEVLFLFRFFIRDIEQQLIKYQCSLPMRLYRGQLMTNEQFEVLRGAIGDFILVNTFLSTSVDRESALALLNDIENSDDIEMRRVLFEIDADPHLAGLRPFANITWLSYFPGQREVLMMVGSIFRLVEIQCDDDQLCIIRMVLCGDNDPELKDAFTRIKKESSNGEIDLFALGHLLCDVGNFDDAKIYYRHLLNDLPTDHQDIAGCYYALGNVAVDKADYDSSLEWYEKLLQLLTRTLKSDDPRLGDTHQTIAQIHSKKNDQKMALEFHNKALTIYKRALGENDVKVAESLDYIGTIYEQQKKYFQALNHYQKALDIRQKCLPADHLDLGRSHSKVGAIRLSLCHYYLALGHYNLSLKIKFNCLPPEHLEIASDYCGMGNVYRLRGELKKAIEYFEKAAEIYRHALAPTHVDLVEIEQTIRYLSAQSK